MNQFEELLGKNQDALAKMEQYKNSRRRKLWFWLRRQKVALVAWLRRKRGKK